MTDKEKILEAIEQKRQAIWPTDTGKMKPATVPNNLEQGWLNALKWMENLINSLPAEQPSEELEKAAIEFSVKQGLEIKPFAIKFFKSGAQWQKEQMLKFTIDGCYIRRNRYTKQNVLNGLSVTCDSIQKLKDGDKVKVIIVKEAEQ